MITMTNSDPHYLTLETKMMIERKNHVMGKGRVEEASALARRIGKRIERSSKTLL